MSHINHIRLNSTNLIDLFTNIRLQSEIDSSDKLSESITIEFHWRRL